MFAFPKQSKKLSAIVLSQASPYGSVTGYFLYHSADGQRWKPYTGTDSSSTSNVSYSDVSYISIYSNIFLKVRSP